MDDPPERGTFERPGRWPRTMGRRKPQAPGPAETAFISASGFDLVNGKLMHARHDGAESRLAACFWALLLYIFYKAECIQSILPQKAFCSNGCVEMFTLWFCVFKKQKGNQKHLIVLDALK